MRVITPSDWGRIVLIQNPEFAATTILPDGGASAKTAVRKSGNDLKKTGQSSEGGRRSIENAAENAAIIQDVVALIDRSRIVVCDCSGRNPNVFYEAGIAHTLGREVILITQSEHDIPFDLRHLRYIRYLNNAEGRALLAQALQNRMQTILGH